MALKDVTREGVDAAIEEFDRIGIDRMLTRHGGGRSTTWYIQTEAGDLYDQKLIVRAAHKHQGLGRLKGIGAGPVRLHLSALQYRVVVG